MVWELLLSLLLPLSHHSLEDQPQVEIFNVPMYGKTSECTSEMEEGKGKRRLGDRYIGSECTSGIEGAIYIIEDVHRYTRRGYNMEEKPQGRDEFDVWERDVGKY